MGGKKMFEDWEKFFTQIGLAAIFAAVCGVAGYLHRQVKVHEPITLVEGLTRALGSGVTGAILMMACQAMKLDPMWTGAIIGTCGWLGADAAVTMLRGMIKRGLRL